MYKKNIKEYRDKRHHINKLLTSLVSQEVDKWSVYDLNKIINWKNVKDVDVTPVSKKDLLVLLDLVRGGVNLPRQSVPRSRWIWMEDSNLRLMTIYEKVAISIKSRQLLSEFFVSVVLIFCETSIICLCR